MLCRAKASSVSQVGLDAVTIVVLFFVTGGVSFCSGVDRARGSCGEPKVTPPSLVYTPSDLTSGRHVANVRVDALQGDLQSLGQSASSYYHDSLLLHRLTINCGVEFHVVLPCRY